MATGQSIRDRLKSRTAGSSERPGVLPLVAFYGREPEKEKERGRMYHQIAIVMRSTDGDAAPEHRRHLTYVFDKGAVSVVNATASPIEYLVSRGEMEADPDEEGMGGARYHTALRLRDLFDGSQVKLIRSPSLEGTGGGGAATSAGDIRGYQLDCMKLVEKLRGYMNDEKLWLFDLVQGAVWKDDWFDLFPSTSKSKAVQDRAAAEREKTIEAIHYGLDYAAVMLGYAPPEDLVKRWPGGGPKQPPVIRRRIQATMAEGRLALRS